MNNRKRLNIFKKDNSIPSVYFYTFHKCASNLFANYILKNSIGLEHVDYAVDIYKGEEPNLPLNFQDIGSIYGPIRLSALPATSVYKNLIIPATQEEFVRNKKTLFFIRDPRDILISAYYSFGHTHTFSEVSTIKTAQEEVRRNVSSLSLENYVLEEAESHNAYFKQLYEIASLNSDSVVIKYEDMIDNFDLFVGQLQTHLNLKKSTIKEIYKRSRPKSKEDRASHRRSGGTNNFRDKLDISTINKLNDTLKETLLAFNYNM